MTQERKQLYEVIDLIKRNKEATTKEEREGKYKKAWSKLLLRLKVTLSAASYAEFVGRPFVSDPIEGYALYKTTDELNKYIGKACVKYADTELVGMLFDDGAKMYTSLVKEERNKVANGNATPVEELENYFRNCRTYAPAAG